MTKKLFFIFCFMLMTMPVLAQSTRLDPNSSPYNSENMNEYSWNTRIRNGETDYLRYTFNFTNNNLTVDVGRQLSSTSDCDGHSASAPSLQINWERNSITENNRLRFFVVSRADTVLIIQHPDGTWMCADDYSTTIHPLLDISRPRTGTYSIWIATKSRANFSADLYITPEDYDPRPNQYNSASTLNWISSNPASGSLAQIMFVDVKDTSTSCQISVDARLANMDGNTAVRMVAYPISRGNRIAPATNNSRYTISGSIGVADEADRIPFSQVSYDYSSTDNPFGVTIPDSALPNDITVYQLEIIIQQQTGSTWRNMTSYTTPTSQSCRP